MDEWLFLALFLCGDLLRRKKEGKRLSFRDKLLFLQVIASIANAATMQHKYSCYNHQKAAVLARCIETFAQEEVNSDSLDDGRDTVPHSIDIHDVPSFESLDEEVYDTSISDETTRQILLLTAACKEFKLRIPENLGYTEETNGQETHP